MGPLQRIILPSSGATAEYQTHPSVLDQAEIHGVPNPVMGWFTHFWTGPFKRQEAFDMMRTLGLRVGLDLGEASLEAAWGWSGGHPSILRQFGSALFEAARDRPRQGVAVDTDPLIERAEDIFLDTRTLATDTIPREIEALLQTRYPSAWALLLRLCQTQGDPAPMSTTEWRNPAARTLRNLGLLQGDRAAPFVPRVVAHHIQWVHPQAPTSGAASG